MATNLSESEEIDPFPVPSSEIEDGSVPKLLNERSFDPQSSSPNRSSSVNHSSSINPNFDRVSLDDSLYSDQRPLLALEQPEETNPSPTLPISLFVDNSFNRPSLEWSAPEENESFPPSLVNIQETRVLPVGAGLANLGNTCFLNAILQCFTHTAPFVEGLRSVNHAMFCDGFDEAFCVLCVIKDHIELSLNNLDRIISPFGLVNNLSYFSSYFRRYQQEDAHEFMQCFLDKLERCLESGAKNKTYSEDDGLVNKVFGGRLMSKLCCCNCGHCSETYEPLVDLSLEIENVDSLSNALESFTKVEKIEDPEAKFRCENCKEEVSVEKQLKLKKIPLVVTFHLKRFKTDGSSVEKVDKHVNFPLELDLQPYTVESQDCKDEFKYELYAIVEHTGFSSSSGHYFSFVRSSPDAWFRMDDSKVTRVSEDYVLSQEAYILLYKRKGTPWFSNLIELQDPCLNSDNSNTSPKSVLDNIDNAHPSCPAKSKISCESAPAPAPADVMELNHAQLSDEKGDKEIGVNNLENVSSTNLHTVESVTAKSSSVGCDDVFLPLTPPRSPSPDISFSRTPEPRYRIPTDHLKTEKATTPAGKSLNKTFDDPARKAALRYIKKSMPSSRGSRMIAAILGPPHNEGSSMNKKRKIRSSPCKRSSPPNNRRKTSHSSVMRYVAAEN